MTSFQRNVWQKEEYPPAIGHDRQSAYPAWSAYPAGSAHAAWSAYAPWSAHAAWSAHAPWSALPASVSNSKSLFRIKRRKIISLMLMQWFRQLAFSILMDVGEPH